MILVEILVTLIVMLLMSDVVINYISNLVDNGKAKDYRIKRDEDGFFVYGKAFTVSCTPKALCDRAGDPKHFPTEKEAHDALTAFIKTKMMENERDLFETRVEVSEIKLKLEMEAIQKRLAEMLDEQIKDSTTPVSPVIQEETPTKTTKTTRRKQVS